MKNEKSCGAIVLNENKVLLVQQRKSGNYGFPKGHMEDGETEIETAIREVKEETGVDIYIMPSFRYSLSYIQNESINKEVVYFIAKTNNFSTICQEAEISNTFWIPIEEVRDTLTYDNLKKIWDKVYLDINKEGNF